MNNINRITKALLEEESGQEFPDYLFRDKPESSPLYREGDTVWTGKMRYAPTVTVIREE